MKGYEKVIYVSVILLLVAAGYFFFLSKVASNKDKISSIMMEIGNESGREGALRFSAKSLQDTEEERALVESMFIPREEMVSFIEVLERFGRESGLNVKIDSIELEKLPVETEEAVLLRLSGKGSYLSIRNYLERLHDMSVANEWQRVMISKQEKEDGGWNLTLEMRALKMK